MNLQMLKSFRFELEKIAARRGLKEIRNLMGAGKAEQAAALARRPGVLKPTVHGHQVRDLGAGSEGLATLTAGGSAHGGGLGVQKIYDPKGIASQELIARKEQAGRAMQNNPHVAQFRGAQKGVGGTTAHSMEYVHGQQPQAQVAGKRNPAIATATRGIAKGMRRAGFAGAADVRPENMVQTPGGQVKAIDFIPTQRGEFASGNERARYNQQRAAIGAGPIGKNIQVLKGDTSPLQDPTGQTSAGQLKAMHFRGAQPAPVVQPLPGAAKASPMAPTKVTPMGTPNKPAPLAPTRPIRAPVL